MSLARERRPREDRRSAQPATLSKARRARRRELALVAEYLALIRFNGAPPRRAWRALAPGAKR